MMFIFVISNPPGGCCSHGVSTKAPVTGQAPELQMHRSQKLRAVPGGSWGFHGGDPHSWMDGLYQGKYHEELELSEVSPKWMETST